MPICLRRATKIVTISHATEEDIITYYKIPKEKITVIYVGFQNLIPYKDTAPRIDTKMIPYFFFTGRVKPRKNVHTIVSAFIRFKKRTHADCKLVIAGKTGGEYHQSMVKELMDGQAVDHVYNEYVSEQLKKDITKNESQNEVFFIGYVSTEFLCSYYLHALAFVFPSLNEGFGMPVVEAMSLGTPVITSSISSLPEAAGDAGLLIDPYDTEALSHAMEKIFYDSDLRTVLIEKGYAQAKKFSWEKTAHEYLLFLEQAVS